jgi:outer membrane protein assembly factor BamA
MATAMRVRSAARPGSPPRAADFARWGIVLVILGSFLWCAPARADSTDSTATYWGSIPAPNDSVCVPLLEPPKPVWERAVLVPYRVVTWPIALLSHGVGHGIAYLDDHRVIDAVSRLLGPRQTPFGFLVDFQFGGLSGLGGGLIAEHTKFLGPGNTLRVRASTTTEHNTRLGLAARFGRARGAFVEFGAGYRHRPNVRYFGIGPYTNESDESFFHQDVGWVGATVRRPFGARSHLEFTTEYTTEGVGVPGAGKHPSPAEQFPGTPLPGYGHHSYGVTVGGKWMHESAGLENRPSHGGIQKLGVSYFDGVDRGDIRFATYRGEVQHFFTLWRPLRILALRGVASWIEQAGTDGIPIARLNTNDDPDLMRGYDDFRWRDRGIAIATAEYRWPIWANQRAMGPGLDAYLLTDAGQVFGDAKEIALRTMKLSYGGGLRVESGHGFVLRLEYARSEETSIIRLRGDQVFQFTKGGFLHGREPIPDR